MDGLLSGHHPLLGTLLILLLLLTVEVVYCNVLVDDLSASARQQLPVVCAAVLLCHEVRILACFSGLETAPNHVEKLLTLLWLRYLLHILVHEAALVREDDRV